MPALPFTKLQGIGNDFVLLDGLKAPLPPWLTHADVVQRLCDRRFGVGADGLLLLLPSQGRAVGRMRVLNADGSEPEMCGNGLRCVGHYLLTEGHVEADSTFSVETGAGVLSCRTVGPIEEQTSKIAIEMGRPSLLPAELPMRASEPQIDAELRCGGETFVGTAISIGNPHFVIFEGDPLRDLEHWARQAGPKLEHHPAFPNRVNVEFARLSPSGAIEAWVWERGSGLTLACGTGACAVAVAATLTGRAPSAPLTVQLPGGTLEIVVYPNLEGVKMTGPAAEVYRGELNVGPQGVVIGSRPSP